MSCVVEVGLLWLAVWHGWNVSVVGNWIRLITSIGRWNAKCEVMVPACCVGLCMLYVCGCVWVCLGVFGCVCMYVWVCLGVCTFVCVHMYMFGCVRVCVYVRVCLGVCTFGCVHVCMCLGVCTFVCVYMYMFGCV